MSNFYFISPLILMTLITLCRVNNYLFSCAIPLFTSDWNYALQIPFHNLLVINKKPFINLIKNSGTDPKE